MRIKDAIKELEKVLKRDGDVEIFFDCPMCNISYTPTTLQTQPATLKISNKEGRQP